MGMLTICFVLHVDNLFCFVGTLMFYAKESAVIISHKIKPF